MVVVYVFFYDIVGGFLVIFTRIETRGREKEEGTANRCELHKHICVCVCVSRQDKSNSSA